jgi:MoxR-like ATPase
VTGGSSLERLNRALSGAFLGQEGVVADLLTALLCRGHVLIEGVPGLGKTLLAKTVAQALGLKTTRVQFTPDLMPSDLLGTSIYRPNLGAFEQVPGPVFTQVLVADEINRTAPKTQAALLECMEERQVSLDGKAHPLDPVFFVVATQNPLELEGTYPLPEAQLDRFLMRIRVHYPEEEAELALVKKHHERRGAPPRVDAVLAPQELLELTEMAAGVLCDESVLRYGVSLVRHTRKNPKVRLGASPRAAQALIASAKARAALLGRGYVTPDEVKAVAPSVLNHRLVLTAEAEVDGATPEDVISATLGQVEVPR